MTTATRTRMMPIFPLFVAALIAIPLLEVYLLIEIGSRIGALSTVALIVATALLGAFLLRQQGLSTLARVRGSIDRGDLPAIEMIEGVILLITAVLLLTPGFFTDAVGFAALLPPLRSALARALAARVQFHIVGVRREDGATYEGEFWRPPHDAQSRDNQSRDNQGHQNHGRGRTLDAPGPDSGPDDGDTRR